MRIWSLLLLTAVLGGCSNLAEINQAPRLSPIGQGLHPDARAVPVEPRGRYAAGYQSLWDEGKDLYRDPRAARVGDLVTVTISMNDKAILDNKTDRSRDSEVKYKSDFLVDLFGWKTNGQADGNVNSKTSTKGAGKIDRTEEVKFSVGAVVVDVLPNGNLLISGSQEVRVNYEMRIVNVAGIVRPRDIGRNNTIAYDKIGEARISYGGRGRLMEVQQPAWGHQIYDQIGPF
jgi:flagellar L-ring protein precursor FlgH